MKPAAKTQDLLYVSGLGGIFVFEYPSGYSVGFLALPAQPQGECVDASGDVFVGVLITSSAYAEGEIYEYAHGAVKPRTILKDGSAEPIGCSIDPATGNLAVTNYCASAACSSGNVAIYAQARGTPKTYQDSAFKYYFYCGYDNESNLFVDGYGASYGDSRFAELPKGRSTFTNIALKRKLPQPGQVQWDGTHIAVGNEGGLIYRTDDSGEILGTTTLLGPARSGRVLVRQFWIQGTAVVGAGRTVRVWPYSAGGRPSKELSPRFPSYGTAVSLAQ